MGIAHDESDTSKTEHLANGNEAKDDVSEDLEALIQQINGIVEKAKELEEKAEKVKSFFISLLGLKINI